MLEKLQRAQRRIRVPRIRSSRLGVTGLASIAALLVIFGLGALLDLRGDPDSVREFGEYVRAAGQRPAVAVANAARSHRFVFLADIHGAAGTKRLAATAIAAMAAGPGLDALVVAVGRDQQPVIDRYIDSAPEDAGLLVSNPRAIGVPAGAGRGLLDVYHQVWQINQKLGPDQRIQILAADLEGWPPDPSTSPAEKARRFAERADSMVHNLERELLVMTPRARVLVFMSGLHALKTGYGELQTGGTNIVHANWFATRLAQRYPGEVYSFLVDAPGKGSSDELVPYTGTRIPETARNVLPSGPWAVAINEIFGPFSRAIEENSIPGLSFQISPRQYRLHDVADGYIYLGR